MLPGTCISWRFLPQFLPRKEAGGQEAGDLFLAEELSKEFVGYQRGNLLFILIWWFSLRGISSPNAGWRLQSFSLHRTPRRADFILPIKSCNNNLNGTDFQALCRKESFQNFTCCTGRKSAPSARFSGYCISPGELADHAVTVQDCA